jgi:cell division protein FtsB
MASPAPRARARAAPRSDRDASPGEGARPGLISTASAGTISRRPYSVDELVNRRVAFSPPRLTRPVVVIVAVAALLAGIVALNVAALRERMKTDDLDAQITELRDERRLLETELSRAGAVGKIEFAAKNRLGLVEPNDVRHVKLPTARAETP